ncbi:MAG: RNA pseudouridine synthase [Desulfobacter sp.]|nr:MAG: RNA pseudouridine synthase [Desulfobacter sp.]
MKQKINIVQRGTGWICVEKPGGISVHNSPGKDVISILGARPVSGIPKNGILQPVHRLDKETWGLLLLATDHETLARLSDLFARGRVVKRYKALVHGNFDLAREAGGIWDIPLSKEAGGRKDPRGRGKKVRAETRYRVIDQSPHYALLDIELFTGRKHQIRRHAKLAGHPVTGDSRYGSPRAIKFLKEQRDFHAMGLQSCYLEFEENGRPVTMELSALPSPMEQLLKEDQESKADPPSLQ